MSNTDYTIDITVEESNIPIDASVYSDEPISTNTRDAVGSTETDHRLLTHRDAPEQHPMSAITGLTTSLQNMSAAIDTRLTANENGIIMLQVDVDGATQRIGVVEGDVVNAATTATNYLTPVSSAGGIRLHDEDSTTLNWVTVDGDGVDVTKSGVSVASFGETTRIGAEDSAHIALASSGLDILDGETSVASFGATVRVGQDGEGYTRTEIDDSGMRVVRKRRVAATVRDLVLADIGYDSTNDAPYFTFGQRSGATGKNSVVAGWATASGEYSFAEGYGTEATGSSAHAEGANTDATDSSAHAEGTNTKASGSASHAEGYYTTASGSYSHAGGWKTVANGTAQTAIGKYNSSDSTSLLIVGNGTSSSSSNAMDLSATGNLRIAGTLTQSSDRRLKEHISYLGEDAVDFVKALKPAHYVKDGQDHTGFYAQDIEAVDTWHSMTGEMNGFKTLGYSELIAPLVAYCQSLEARIEELERSN